jgi:transposase-like protein
MVGSMRKSYDAKFRAKVALEAVKGERTMAELSRKLYGFCAKHQFSSAYSDT